MTVAFVACSDCKQKKFVNPQALAARIAKYGSIEEIEKQWKCRACSKNYMEPNAPKESVSVDRFSIHYPRFYKAPK